MTDPDFSLDLTLKMTTTEVVETTATRNNEDQNSPITANHPATYGDTQPVVPITCDGDLHYAVQTLR